MDVKHPLSSGDKFVKYFFFDWSIFGCRRQINVIKAPLKTTFLYQFVLFTGITVASRNTSVDQGIGILAAIS
jgi:hypothetical protein